MDSPFRVSNRPFLAQFLRCPGILDLEKDERFVTVVERKKNFRELTATIENVFKTKPRDEWVKLLETKGGGLAFSPILKLTELADDPQVRANEYVTTVQHPTLGPINVVGTAVNLSDTRLPPGAGRLNSDNRPRRCCRMCSVIAGTTSPNSRRPKSYSRTASLSLS